MIDNEELPIGFTMELAQHSDILNQFASLSKEEQASITDGAKQIRSRDEMRNYVESIFKGLSHVYANLKVGQLAH